MQIASEMERQAPRTQGFNLGPLPSSFGNPQTRHFELLAHYIQAP